MDNINIVVTLGCTLIGAYVGVMSYKNSYKKEIKADTVQQTKIEVQLSYISQGIIDIQTKLNNQDKFNNDILVRVAKVEESTKSAHHRIDEISQ
ncbi:hypothetical protein [Clostridium saccharoperbutylacetonicum]|uniref:hypothetical protein n=1 Tax=Clostridium saccharoperbutylacetonicum TaxID=36745 RepID=UPI000983DE01|nr:hypothetical protein [Clostridium saccharoperbutylacetonicum]AQR98101.1 hypothetical protein CLSAP_54520 [Clostridium saccharoperbutylacetonicum]NSB33995.1 hypothetical protein [Clostridium saccharoperbutylacetonicum]